MRFSSSFKVGILSLAALFILLFTILWVKGRSFSSADRLDVTFKDVNGMRPGSAVQMMGLRVGQVEEIIPQIKGSSSSVKLVFVITEPGISIPKASEFSIQQSGIIGEQFLEITPPRTRTTYLSMTKGANLLYKNDPVRIMLDEKYYDVGKVKDIQVMSSTMVPAIMKEKITTNYAYKVDYIIDLPGLIIPNFMLGNIVTDEDVKKLQIAMMDGTVLPYPKQTSPYTVIEPMRLADFMDLMYGAAESLTETNLKINELLSDTVIADLKSTFNNVNVLTEKAATTIEKAEKLIDSSKDDIDTMITMITRASESFVELSDNINSVVGDEEFKPQMLKTAKSIQELSDNVNGILGSKEADKFKKDLVDISKNVNEITAFVADMTKDEKLKKELMTSVDNINKAMVDISNALELVNGMTPDKKYQVVQIMSDVSCTASNLKKFSAKLNKRFLLFRLMF